MKVEETQKGKNMGAKREGKFDGKEKRGKKLMEGKKRE